MKFEEIIQTIVEKAEMSKEEVLKKVEEKLNELSGLITREGAALLIARELGLEIRERRDLKIKDIDFGMRNFNTRGRIFKISRITEFERNDGSKGRVVNLYIADETGQLRIPLWDKQVKILEENEIKEGDVIQVINGIARENIFGDLEISLGKYGRIRKIEDGSIPPLEELLKKVVQIRPKRILIKEIDRKGYFEILGTIVNVFKGKYIFEVCPICNLAIEGSICAEHGKIEPKKALVISTIIDDGTSSIRAVFFRENAEKLIGMSAEELKDLDLNERYEFIFKKIVGREFVFRGRVKKNKIFDRFELIVNDFEPLNYLEESRKLAEEIELMVKK